MVGSVEDIRDASTGLGMDSEAGSHLRALPSVSTAVDRISGLVLL